MKYAVKDGCLYLKLELRSKPVFAAGLDDATLCDSVAKAVSRVAHCYGWAEHLRPGYVLGSPSTNDLEIVEIEEIAQPRYREGRTL